MKKLLSTLIGICITLTLWAQVPSGFNYQAVLRDDKGEALTNQTVAVSISILEESVEGSAVYTEEHDTQTNAFGLVNLQIGQGTTSGDFSSIDWEKGLFFIQVAVNGTLFGTSQLLSVPYALYAEEAGNVFSGSFNDLTEVPLVFDTANSFTGSFGDLTDIPENLDIDSTDDFSGDYNDLTNKPEIPEAGEQVFSKNDSVVFIQEKKVGIGTEAARGQLEVFNGGVVFAGDTGIVEISGAGTRLMWIPEKAAFRAGKVFEEEWDIDSIGVASIAMGSGTEAKGEGSTAMGAFTKASGSVSTAMGSGTEARGTFSIAMGEFTIASGDHSTAMGKDTNADGNNSTAMGNATEASETSSTAMGHRTKASGLASTTMGDSTKASGEASTAMGFNTEASGNGSTAMGAQTIASGTISTAIGVATKATEDVATAIGFHTTASGEFSTALGNQAKAHHDGAIVIAANANFLPIDSITSAAAAQMVLRADGNFFFCHKQMTVPNEPEKLINTSTGAFLSMGGNWTNASDRNLKENFTSISAASLLEKIKALEVTTWNYKAESDSITHIGPMAQDFYHLYGLGQDDKSISTVDGIGVALATIKALQAENEVIKSELEAIKIENEQLKEQLEQQKQTLETRVSALERVQQKLALNE